MRFVDANVLIYSILKPKRKMTKLEQKMKENAKKIFHRINGGEEVVISTAHISEIANVLEDVVNLTFSIGFSKDLLLKPNIDVEQVDEERYMAALVLAEKKGVSANDALAYKIMKEKKISEIYSFDKHFDNLPVIRVVK
ncbi:MAG: type II toxin-antitoxin system VapC family toxin [Candidatus Hydrothermarchaeales archaeon]